MFLRCLLSHRVLGLMFSQQRLNMRSVDFKCVLRYIPRNLHIPGAMSSGRRPFRITELMQRNVLTASRYTQGLSSAQQERRARKSIHHRTRMRSETPCSTTDRLSSGLANRRACHYGMRAGPVQVSTNHEDHTYTLEIHLHNSTTVESNLPADGRPN